MYMYTCIHVYLKSLEPIIDILSVVSPPS